MASRTIRVSDPNFDSEGYAKWYGPNIASFLDRSYLPSAMAVDFAQRRQQFQGVSTLDVSLLSNDVMEAAHAAWNPNWAYLSLAGLLAPLHKSVLRNNAKNFVHPIFRRVAVPFALTAVAASSYNAYSRTLDGQYDTRTAQYQATANLTWQLLNNYVLPATLMRIFGRPSRVKVVTPDTARLAAIGVPPEYTFKTSSRRTYGAAILAAGIAFAVGAATKYEVERRFVNRRFSRKDYGSHGHSYETTSITRDGQFDFLEQEWNHQGDEYVLDPVDEKAIAEIFPYFSLAEALPTHEVPYFSNAYQNQTPQAYHAALAQGTLDLTVKQGQVPVPSPSTFLRESDQFGEWSLATPYQLAADHQLLNHPLGRKALLNIFSTTMSANNANLEDLLIDADALEKAFVEGAQPTFDPSTPLDAMVGLVAEGRVGYQEMIQSLEKASL